MTDLMTILCGTWSAPEGKVTTRRCSVMKGLSNNMTDHIKQSDAHADTEISVLRLMREAPNVWFSPSDIRAAIETKFSVGNLGLILRGMVKDEFLVSKKKNRYGKSLLYKFNGVRR